VEYYQLAGLVDAYRKYGIYQDGNTTTVGITHFPRLGFK
jgi:hypothetical protein